MSWDILPKANLQYFLSKLKDIFDQKVDKVSGKGLSTNDYTTTEKNKLSGIAAGAEVNVQSDWNVTNTSSDAFIKNKPTIPDNNRKSFFGTCNTPAATSKKVVTLSNTDGWELKAGTIVGIKFNETNTASNVTLNINGTGDKPIYYSTSVQTGVFSAIIKDVICYWMYDGTNWSFLNNGNNWRDTNTHRPINVNGTQLLGNNTTAVNFKNGTNTTVVGSGADIQIDATDTNTTYTFAEGSTNGAFSVTPSGGSAQSVPIHGLGDRAYDSTTYIPSTGGTFSGDVGVVKSNQTTSSVDSYMILGNNKGSGTAGCARGVLQIFAASKYRTNIYNRTTLTDNRSLYIPNKTGTLAVIEDLPTYTDVTVNTDSNGFANIVSDAVPEKTISAFVLFPARASCELWLNYIQENENYEGGYRAYVYTRGPSKKAVASQSVTIRLWKMP